MPSSLSHQTVKTNGINMHIAVQGDGVPVIMIHGFPGLWYSWRHQLPAVAAAGWRRCRGRSAGLVAGTDRPTDPAVYDMNYMIGDMLGVLDALGEKQAVFVGHDFGAPLVWNLAVRKPERVKAIVAMAAPYDFDLAGRGGDALARRQATRTRRFQTRIRGPGDAPDRGVCRGGETALAFHMSLFFRRSARRRRELQGANARLFLTKLFWALSAKGNLLGWEKFPSEGTGYLEVLADPPSPPPWPWLSAADMDYYVAEYTKTGPDTAFIGGLNSYRVADKNWEMGERYADANVECPTLFIAGADDPVLKMIPPEALDIMKRRVPGLRGIEIVPDAGHFVQQEQPQAVNAAIVKFLDSLKS